MRAHWLDQFEEVVANRDEFVTHRAYQWELERIIEEELEVRIANSEDRYDEGYDEGFNEARDRIHRAIEEL
jgi:hypothetical protein